MSAQCKPSAERSIRISQLLTTATIQMSVHVKHEVRWPKRIELARRCGTLMGARHGVVVDLIAIVPVLCHTAKQAAR